MSPAAPLTLRRPAIAGSWYPGSAPVLRQTVETYLNQVKLQPLPGKILALVSPHAGYGYSGSIAAHAFAQVRGAAFARVALIGPLHGLIQGSPLGVWMVPREDAYETPLGIVPVDREAVAALGQNVPLTAVRGDQEHSVEIELPFLQVMLEDFKLLPIMTGEYIGEHDTPAHVEQLADGLAELCADGQTLMIASTDLSHLRDYAEVERIDRKLVDMMAAFDVEGLMAALRAEEVQACGAVGLVTVLRAAQKLGARDTAVLAYASSGDITGNKRPGVYTVGYLAAAAYL